MSQPVLLALIGAVTVLLGADKLWSVIGGFVNRRRLAAKDAADIDHIEAETAKVNADAAALISVTATGMIEHFQRVIDDLERRLTDALDTCKALREELSALGTRNAELLTELESRSAP